MQRQLWRHNPHLLSNPPLPERSELPFRVELEILRGRVKQRIRPILNPAYLIGMAVDCDLVLGDPQFPEVHTYIRISDAGVTLRHLGFAPALTINGETAAQQKLEHGDRIRTGPFEFLVHIHPQASGDDDDSDRSRTLRVPAALDRVEDEVGSALVQQLLAEIRRELEPAAKLKLFVAPESSADSKLPPSASSHPQEPRHAYARSS